MVKLIGDTRPLYKVLKSLKRSYAKFPKSIEKQAILFTDITELTNEITKFIEDIYEESFKERLKTIRKLEEVYEKKKIELEDCHNQIELPIYLENIKEEIQLAEKVLIGNYPYAELISEVLKLQPWYNNVIDIIKHFVAKNFVLKQLDSEFFKTDYNTNVKVDTDKTRCKAVTKRRKAEIPFWVQVNDFKKHQRENVCVQWKTDDIEQIKRNMKTNEDSQNLMIINAILQQYMDLYLNNHGYFPAELPSIENQLLYSLKFFEKSMKLLDIYKNVVSGKMTMMEYNRTRK